MIASPAELAYFIEVAATLNLSRASERLGISQPSLSAAIKRLEYAVGTDLLSRHKRGVTLTQAGKQLLAHSKQLMQYWDEVKSQALASSHEVQGHYVIGCHSSIALHGLAGTGKGFLASLLLKHPKLEIQFEHDLSRKITERVINLAIDLGIVVNPIKHPDLIIQKLADDEVTFYRSLHHKNDNQCIESGKAVIICDIALQQVQWLLKKMEKKGYQFSRMMTSSSLEVIAGLISQGCGIGILPGSVGKSYAKHITPVSKMPVYRDEICLVYRNENRGAKAMQILMSSIKSMYK